MSCLRLFLLCMAMYSTDILAQALPTAPNQRNGQGQRTGEWVINYTKSWKETIIADSIAFYRKIAFDAAGKPQGKTRDYYRSGALQFEGMLLQIEPQEIADGLCVWYHPNGTKSKEAILDKGEEQTVKTWYENSHPQYQYQYQYENKNGQIEGVVWVWDAKGDSTKLYFENGKKLEWQTLNQEVIKLYQQGNYAEATEIAQKCVKIALLTLGEAHSDYASSLNNLANLYRSQGHYAKAESFYEQALAISKKSLGEEHPSYATSLDNLAGLYSSQGHYAKAEPFYEQALTIRKKSLGEAHPHYATSLNNLAAFYESQGHYAKAEPFYERASQIYKKSLGEAHPDYAQSLNNLAGLYESQGHYAKAEPLYEQASQIYKKSLGEAHPDYAQSLNNLAFLYKSQGHYAKAEPFYEQALAIRKKSLGEAHPDYAQSLNNLALLYWSQGHYAKAEPFYEQALAIRKKSLGVAHPDYASSLNNLAALYASQGQYAKAEPFYEQALSITEKSLGELHPDYATSLNNLAGLYRSQGHYAKAEPLYEQASQIYKKSLGEAHPSYATSLNNLAGLYYSQGHYAKAEPFYEQALAIRKKSLGKAHPSYATSLNNLAGLYESQGQYAKAEPFYEQASQIYKKSLGEFHPHYAQSLNNLARLYKSQREYDKAEPFFLQSLQIERKNLLTFFEVANQTQQQAYFNQKEYLFELENSFGLLAHSAGSINSAYQSALVTKGLQLQTLSQLLSYVRQSKDTLLQAQYEQYQTWRTQQVNPNTKPALAAQLRNQSDSLNQVMARKSAVLRNFKAAFQITAKDIQKKLKPHEVAIEFVHFQYHNGQRWTDSTYYAALVLRPGWAAPRMVYLCEERALDSLFGNTEVRRQSYVEHLYGSSVRGPGVLSLTKAPRSLYSLIWQPIDTLLSGVTTVYYSPSGLLHRLNLAAIATLVEEQTLLDRYPHLIPLRSTRELALPVSISSYPNTALLMGGIEYSLDSLRYQLANADFVKHRGLKIDSLSRGGSFQNLRHTAKEIADTHFTLQSGNFRTDTLRGLRASEEGFHYYIQTQKPRVIHLATHGFFNEDTLRRRRRNKDLHLENEPVFITSADPMLRSGLVLAGGNRAWLNQAVPANQADGILTAAEISSTRLDQTELVILSACDTGLGDVRGSEGVFGLQRAFKIAGAKYLMMTLWQVQDDIPPRFMALFYKHWLADPNQNIRKAFDETILQFRQTYSSPYYWAAFVLIE
jgi:tetratricopeptide (TPR) repeat protein/CHAT domain-containing protein